MCYNNSDFSIKKGDIFHSDLGSGIGSEQEGERPVIVLQNDIGNKFSPTVIIASITSQIDKAKLPTHVEISGYGLRKNSVILLEQIRTIDKKRLGERIGHVDNYIMDKVNEATIVSLKLAEDKRIKIAKGKADKIYTIENFLRDMVRYNNTESGMFGEYMKQRKLYLKDLESFCDKNKLNYTEFYNVQDTKQAIAV